MRRAPAARSRRAHRPRRRARVLLVGLVAACALLVTGCFGAAEPGAPGLITSIWVDGLSRAWDLAFLPSGLPVYTENDSGQISARFGDGDRHHALGRVSSFDGGFSASGEGGLMGLAIDPAYGTGNLRAYVCYSTTTDNRVARFDLNPGATPAISNWTVIIQGIPHNPGFHNGCRVRFQPGTGALFVSTGDAGTATAPQDDNSLGGKILRVTTDGTAWPGNASGKLWYSKGHRNPQGIAFRPGSNDPYSVEHGPDVNDEVNKLVNGGDAGWNPNDGAGGYDQSKPMTGPGATELPTWVSGGVTVAPSGGTFLVGAQWKTWNGALAVACLDGSPSVGQRMLVMSLDGPGTGLTHPAASTLAIRQRLRVPVEGPDGNLYVVTDGDGGGGGIWRVVPL